MSGGNAGVLGGEMRGVLSFPILFFKDAVSCYRDVLVQDKSKCHFLYAV